MRSFVSLALFLWLLWCCCAVECSLVVGGGKDAWLRPGCHKVGNTRKISIPDCVEFTITTNACRGFCESYAVPSIPSALNGLFRAPKPVVSVGQCCNMMQSEDVSLIQLSLISTLIHNFKSTWSRNTVNSLLLTRAERYAVVHKLNAIISLSSAIKWHWYISIVNEFKLRT